MTVPSRERLSILFVDHYAGIAGAEMSMLELAAALQERGHRVAIAAPAGGALCARVARGIEFFGIHPPMLTRRKSLAANARMLWRAREGVVAAASRWQPDVVVANSVQAAAVVAVAFPGPRHLPWVWHYRYDFGPGRLVQMMVRLLAGRADVLVPISEPLVDRLRALGVPPAKVALVRNAIDVSRLTGANARSKLEHRLALGLPVDAPIITTVGQVCDRKDQKAAVDVAARLVDAWPDLSLLLVGDALDESGQAYQCELRAMVDSLGVGAHVQLMGNRGDVADILRASDVLLHPAKSEAFGRVLAEAMYLGLPVVASETSGATEIVVSGVTGLVVPIGDTAGMAASVSRLLSDRPTADAMGTAGHTLVVANYSICRAVGELEGIFYELRERCGAAGQRRGG